MIACAAFARGWASFWNGVLREFAFQAGDEASITFTRSIYSRPWERYGTRCCSSVVERVLGKDEVLGSTPSSSFPVLASFGVSGSQVVEDHTAIEYAEERWLRTYS